MLRNRISLMVLGFALAGLSLSGCAQSTSAGSKPAAAAPARDIFATKPGDKVGTTPGGVKYIEVKEGKGEGVAGGDRVFVLYTGWTTDGVEFDSSKQHGGDPLDFVVDTPGMIQGWHEGLKGMKVGGTRKLLIPSDLAYGKKGRPPVIPPNADLIFEIELLKIGS
jgi:peptidylprolyl isomerase